jgi:prolipoprotein diacylglyceryltransferase
VLAAFLVGMLFARKKLLKDYKSNKSFFVKAFWWGLGIGIPSNILYVMSFNNINYAYPDSWLLINTLMLLHFRKNLHEFYLCMMHRNLCLGAGKVAPK